MFYLKIAFYLNIFKNSEFALVMSKVQFCNE
jgi:hypothetical protein